MCMFEDTWCYVGFCLAEAHMHLMFTVYFISIVCNWQNVGISIHSSIAVPMWFPFPVSVIYAPLSCWASLITRKDHVGLRPHMVLLKFFGSVHVVTKQCEPDQHGGDANSDISILLMKLGRNIHTTSWSTQLTEVFIQSKGHPPVPLCRGQVSLFATAVVCHTLRYFLSFVGASASLISYKPSVTGLCGQSLYLSRVWGSFEKLLANHTWSSWFNHTQGTNSL